jgi:hypothetical protein
MMTKVANQLEKAMPPGGIARSLLRITLLALCFTLAASCAKKASEPIRIKSRQPVAKSINETVSKESQLQATNQQINYEITVIERPSLDSENQAEVIFEVKTPDGRFVPITTSHAKGSDAMGVFDDTAKNGIKLDIRARCEGDSCEKYLLLVTAVKNGYAHHQIVAISYASDCHFNVDHINHAVRDAQLIRTFEDINRRYQGVQPNSSHCAEASESL